MTLVEHRITSKNDAESSSSKFSCFNPKISQVQLDDGWPESEKNVFQAALRMVVVKDSR